jgi:phosphatidate cytidylyltransferase
VSGETGSARQMSNLQLRIISSVVLIVAVLAVTFLGGVAFRLLSALIAAVMFYEWCAISRPATAARHQLVAAVLLGVVLLAMVLGYSAAGVLVLLALSVLASLLDSRIAGQGSWAPAGLAYAGLSGLSLAWLRDGDQPGLTAILFLFAVVWATDIAAYFVGRAVGGPKLAPRLSPNKTWSGSIGGLAGAVLAAVLVVHFGGVGGMPAAIVVAIGLSSVAQIGDLVESAIKRRFGVKDASSLIPGHGGLMDRLDGFVAAAVLACLIGLAHGGMDAPARGLLIW